MSALLFLPSKDVRVFTSKTKHVKVSNGNEKKVRLFIFILSFRPNPLATPPPPVDSFLRCRLHFCLT